MEEQINILREETIRCCIHWYVHAPYIFVISIANNFFLLEYILRILGQVHHGVSLNKQDVAIKIQYPGVAQGIQSDIENLVGIMKV